MKKVIQFCLMLSSVFLYSFVCFGEFSEENLLLQKVEEKAADQGFQVHKWMSEPSIFYGDFNLDDKLDIVAVVGIIDEEINLTIEGYIWVATLNQDGSLEILYRLSDVKYGGLFNRIELSQFFDPQLNKKRDSFSVTDGSEGRGGKFSHTVEFTYINGKFVPCIIYDHIEDFDGLSTTWYENLITFEASHSYFMSNQSEDAFSYLEGHKQYYYFYAGKTSEIQVDGVMEDIWEDIPWVEIKDQKMVIYGQDDWAGPKDVSFRAKTILNENRLYVYIEVTDDQIVMTNTTDLKQDHVEIWLDSLSSLRTEKDSELYLDLPYRRTKAGLYQFGINRSGAYQYLPKEGIEKEITYQIVSTPKGYNVEMSLPIQKYLQSPFKTFSRIGFTIVISDTDLNDTMKQDTLIATSSLKWGDPYTLGEIRRFHNKGRWKFWDGYRFIDEEVVY